MRIAGKRLGAITGLGILALGLSGCAMDSINFPRVSDLTDGVRKVLSPDERDQAIKEMALQQAVHRDTAISDIEKR